MHRQYKGIGLTADVKVLRILQLAEVLLAGKPSLYQRLRTEVQDGSPNIAGMICAIPSPEWTYHTLRNEQHVLDIRMSKLIDEWATSQELTTPDSPEQASDDPPKTNPPEIDIAMTASRDELITAFRPYTGMDKSWFKDLADVPGLKSALATKGRRGKNSVQPRFFVFPVMQWLVFGRHKISKPIQEDTAWRILKNKFPKVYEVYQSLDPRDAG